MKTNRNIILTSLRNICVAFIFVFGVLSIIGSGSDDDDEGTITIHNYDNHDYYVELRRTSDNTVVDTLNVHDLPSSDTVDTFHNVDEGDYYIIIYDGGEVDRTSSFHLDDNEYECFEINNNGNLNDC